MKKCKNITFCHFFAFGGPCDVQKWVKVYKVYVSWKPCLYSLRRHQKKWFLSNWGRTRCNRSAQGLKMANCTSFKILTHIYNPFASTHGQYTTPTCPKCAYKILQIFLRVFEFALAEFARNTRKLMYREYFHFYSTGKKGLKKNRAKKERKKERKEGRKEWKKEEIKKEINKRKERRKKERKKERKNERKRNDLNWGWKKILSTRLTGVMYAA